MNKPALISEIISRLATEVAQYQQAALATHADATNEENKAEDKYDTRGLEASYLALGQSRQAEEAAQARHAYEALVPRDFTIGDPVSLGAFVTLEARNGKLSHYFVGPRAGGMELTVDGKQLLVITPQSPLGRQLLGHHQGTTLQLEIGGRRNEYRIASVQ